MRKCKITVVKKNFDAELVEAYGNPGFAPCSQFEIGQEFIVDWRKPENFCDDAWKTLSYYVMTLVHGGERFYNGNWVRFDNVALTCCNDAMRPVVFKIEALPEGE